MILHRWYTARHPKAGDRGSGTQKLQVAAQTHHAKPSAPTPGRHHRKQQQSTWFSFSKSDSTRPNNPQGQVNALGKNTGMQPYSDPSGR